MARQVPQRRTAAAVLVAALLLSVPVAAVAAPAEDRAPAHADNGEAAPSHAHSAAPEDRPPAHSRARRASARHGGGARTADGPVSSAPPSSSSRGRISPPPPHAAPAGPAAPGGGGPPAGAPAHGHGDQDPEPTPDDADPGTELDTDGVVVGPAPTPDRAPLAADGPVLPAPLVLVAAPILGVAPTAPFAGLGGGGAPADGAPGGGGTGAGGAGVGEDPGSAGGPLTAPRTRSVPEPFGTPELTRRVVVPVVVLVAGLVYLLAQSRIDRRAELLLAPVAPGTEHDDDVYEL